MRPGLLLLLLALPAAAGGESRLGSLIRWYLNERRPAGREGFLDAIRALTRNDPHQVAEAIRKGLHFEHEARPKLQKGGPVPVFGTDRRRIQPLAASAGDFATLYLPEGYDPKRAHPLVLDLGPTPIDVPETAVVVRVEWQLHPQARNEAMAAEALVLSLLAHLYEVVHTDPDRVFLRAQLETAPLAWYIALHNPDRFAGVLAAQGWWKEAPALGPNARQFSLLAIERRGGDRGLSAFMKQKLRGKGHLFLQAPRRSSGDAALRPAIRDWQLRTVRRPEPGEVQLVCNRKTRTRAYWISVAPKIRSLKQRKVGRHWSHRATNRIATLQATVSADVPNLVLVEMDRVLAFDIFVDPKMFDAELPLRVKIGKHAPIARVIDIRIADLLEDYRARRDPGLLYCCTLSFP